MEKGTLSRQQVIEIAGLSVVKKVEYVNCKPTNRVGYNGACQGDELIEWASSTPFVDVNGIPSTLVAYYYTTQEEIDESRDDLGSLYWEIFGYEVF